MNQVPQEVRARILLVEDDPGVARLTAAILRNEGYAVDVLHRHDEAPPRLTTTSYALVITDTHLGARTAELDGLAPLIRAAGSAPVLLFTAHRFRPAEVSRAGFSGMIKKPFDIDDMLRLIDDSLGVTASSVKTQPA